MGKKEECILDTSKYICDDDDTNCIENVVDLLLRTEFKGTLTEQSKLGGITQDLIDAVDD